MTQVHPLARPFAWEGTKELTCLLVHGFTGSPSELRPLADYLQARGYGGSAVLLPGHGTTPQDMAKTSWQDWYRVVEEEYLRLCRQGKWVLPIGFSMGGILCLHLAAQQQNIPGVVTLSSPIFIGNRKAYLAPVLRFFYRYRRKPVAAEVQAQKLAEGYFSYSITPISSLASLLQIIRLVKKELAGLQLPTLIMQSWADRTVNPKSAEYIFTHLGCDRKGVTWWQESREGITRGPEQGQVFREVDSIITELVGGGSTSEQ